MVSSHPKATKATGYQVAMRGKTSKEMKSQTMNLMLMMMMSSRMPPVTPGVGWAGGRLTSRRGPLGFACFAKFLNTHACVLMVGCPSTTHHVIHTFHIVGWLASLYHSTRRMNGTDHATAPAHHRHNHRGRNLQYWVKARIRASVWQCLTATRLPGVGNGRRPAHSAIGAPTMLPSQVARMDVAAVAVVATVNQFDHAIPLWCLARA